MATHRLLIISILCFCSLSVAQKYKICTTPQNLNACEQLNRTEDIKCLLRKNAVDCLLMVENGEATFTSVSAEEAFLASSLTSNLVVLGEFIDQNNREAAELETAVLVRKDIYSDIKSLKNAKYCHPGMDVMPISPSILKELEMNVISQNNIEVCPEETDAKTLTEYYVKTLNDFFGVSCRPGRWTITNSTLDTQLKQKYTNLLQLCSTSTNSENLPPFLQSLHCLTNDGGDIALTSISSINNYIVQSTEIANNYSLLCKDGSLVNITGRCTWTRQTWPLLIGHNESSVGLPLELRTWFSEHLHIPIQPFTADANVLTLASKYIQNLRDVIFPTPFYLINVTDNTPNLLAYITDFRTVPTTESSRLCKSSVGLCVSSTEETQKCKWLQKAALNYGVQPVMSCITKTSKSECLQAVQNNIADMVVVDSNMMYSVNRLNLSIIALAEETREYMTKTVLVVKTATVQSLGDLRNKSGFFSEYGDMAWTAFADTLRKSVWTDSNSYGSALSHFLGDSCMPGIKDSEHERYPFNILADKMCALCSGNLSISTSSTNCNFDPSNICYGNEGALTCLSYTGDFAVVTIKENLILPNGTNIMCKNGSLSTTNTFNIDEDCALSFTVGDQVVVRKHDSKNKDIEMLLQELDERFAAQTYTSFKIFDRFGSGKDLIFKDTTLGVEVASTSTNKYIKAQLEIFKNIPDITTSEETKGSASIHKTSLLLLFILVLFVI